MNPFLSWWIAYTGPSDNPSGIPNLSIRQVVCEKAWPARKRKTAGMIDRTRTGMGYLALKLQNKLIIERIQQYWFGGMIDDTSQFIQKWQAYCRATFTSAYMKRMYLGIRYAGMR